MNSQDKKWIEETSIKIEKKYSMVSDRSCHKIPYTTKEGVHDDRSADNVNWWTNGFWGGMLWMLYKQTGDIKYKEYANNIEQMLDKAMKNFHNLDHDVGFLWTPTSVTNYRLTGSETSKRRGIHAANILAGRYNPVGEYIRAWDKNSSFQDTRGISIIDTMMNLPLLYWSSAESGDPRFKQIAMKHADTSMKCFVRSDGSVSHIVEFNPEDGMVVNTHGGQGYERGSSWSRGQAWGIYGFALSYIYTKREEYLDTAKRIAHYFIANVSDDFETKLDFRAPREPYYVDNTAGAIAACGLIEIARHVKPYEQALYLDTALRLLKVLYRDDIDWSYKTDHLLTRCSAKYHEENHHYSIIYGDSFFMEAIFKLRGNDIFMW